MQCNNQTMMVLLLGILPAVSLALPFSDADMQRPITPPSISDDMLQLDLAVDPLLVSDIRLVGALVAN